MLEVAPMPTNATRLSDRQLKAVKATGKDFVLSDGDGLQLRVRASGSMMWNFNYREPLIRSRCSGQLIPDTTLSFSRPERALAGIELMRPYPVVAMHQIMADVPLRVLNQHITH